MLMNSKYSLRFIFAIYALIAILAIIGIIYGATNLAGELSHELLFASFIVFIVVLICMCFLMQIGKTNASSGSTDAAKLDAILEAMQMSENAKRILFRDREKRE